MVNWWQGLVLGVLQGVTEFLPVSSSGHLVLMQSLLPGFVQPGILFDVTLHLATSLAVVLYFNQELLGLLKRKVQEGVAEKMGESGKLERIDWRLIGMIILALIPTGILGFLLKDLARAQFENPLGAGFFLVLTGILLFSADFLARKKPDWLSAKDPGIWQSLVIGISQGLAVLPGLSRSGATISAGIFSGIRGDYAVRFSFLLSVPAVLGATVLELLEEREAVLQFQSQEIFAYLLGMASAFGMGYLSIRLMFTVVRRIQLSWFGGYCLVVGILAMLLWSLNK